MKYVLMDSFKSDYESSCGLVCRDMQQAMGASLTVDYAQSNSDKTQYIMVSSNVSHQLAGSMGPVTFYIMAFRGTTLMDFINWRRNFNFKFAPTTLCSMCEVHEGFWRNFLALRPAIVCSVERIYEVTFTGMSMGAPLATMAALQAAGLHKMVKGC